MAEALVSKHLLSRTAMQDICSLRQSLALQPVAAIGCSRAFACDVALILSGAGQRMSISKQPRLRLEVNEMRYVSQKMNKPNHCAGTE